MTHCEDRSHTWEKSLLNSFNRTSFQQQLKLGRVSDSSSGSRASIVHPFNNNWNSQEFQSAQWWLWGFNRTSFQQQLKRIWANTFLICLWQLQSYILSTTTETFAVYLLGFFGSYASIVHPFNNNWNLAQNSLDDLTVRLQSYILSTTTETWLRV